MNTTVIIDNISSQEIMFTEYVTENTTASNVTTSPLPEVVAHSISTSQYATFATTIVILALGLFGNILTIIVTTRPKNKYGSHGIYLTALALADIMSLLIVTINKPLIINIFGVDLRAFTLVGCKVFKHFGRVSIICSSCIVVLICIERFIAIWFPLKAKLLLSKKAAITSVLTIFIATVIITSPSLVYTGLKRGICLTDFAMKPNHPLTKSLSMISVALYCILPLIILLCLTPLTIYKVYQQRFIRRQMADQRSRDPTRRITAMFTSVVLSYFLLICVPTFIFWTFNLSGVNVLASSDLALMTFRNIYEHAGLINYSIHFFLYGLTSVNFRYQVCELFGCDRRNTPRTSEQALPAGLSSPNVTHRSTLQETSE